MTYDFHFLKVKTEQAIADAQRLSDREFADLMATTFGVWSLIVSLGLYTTDTALISGILPSAVIAAASGINIYKDRQGHRGHEELSGVAILTGFWMLMASAFLEANLIMQYTNTFSAMWVCIASTYASFLRQNDPERETILIFKYLHP